MTKLPLSEVERLTPGGVRESEAARRVLDRFSAEAEREMAAERAAAAAAHEAALQREDAQRQAVEAQIVAVLSPLRSLYDSRDGEAAIDVVKAVRRFLTIEADIQRGLDVASQLSAEIAPYVPSQDRRNWPASLRRRAGLSAQHTDGLPQAHDEFSAAARVVCWLLASRSISGNSVTINGSTLTV